MERTLVVPIATRGPAAGFCRAARLAVGMVYHSWWMGCSRMSST